MATFNTAFGALPSTQDALGVNNNKKPGASTPAPKPTPTVQPTTFADLQKQGQARPAPPAQAAPAPMSNQAAPAPPMLAQLQQTLTPPASPPPPAQPPAEPPVTVPGGGVLNEDGSSTWSNVETPTGNEPAFTAGQAPPANAPNGSTYTDANGTKWTKRGGVWALEAVAGQNMPTGYAALNPMAGQTLPEGLTSGFSGNGLEQFLRTFGTPKTPEEMSALAASADMTPAQLQQFIGSKTGIMSFNSQDELAGFDEQRQWMTANNVTNIPDGYAYVPASQGGPGLRRLTWQERSAQGATFGGESLWNDPNNAALLAQNQGLMPLLQRFGVNLNFSTSPATGGGTPGTTGMATGGGTPGTATGGGVFAGGQAPTGGVGATSFAPGATGGQSVLSALSTQLGVAAPSAPASTGITTKTLQQQLFEAINGIQGANREALDAQGRVKRADLESEFRSSQRNLQEELARRGLSASTIGANQMGDLSGDQARALSALEADLLAQQANMDMQAQQQRIAGLTSLTEITANIETKAKELQQQAALEGRSLDLQQARDQATRELGFAGLAQEKELETARLGEQQALRLQNLGISNRELDLRATEIRNRAALEGRQLDLQQARDLAEVDFRTRQLMQEDKRLTYQQANDKANRELTKTEGALDRALRDKLGLGQLEIDRLRATQEGRAFLVQLAQLIGVDKLTPEQLRSLGITPSAPGVGGGTGTGVGSGGGSGGGGSNTDFSF